MKAALYVRVSSEEQKKYGWSVDTQISDLEAYCSANGHEIVDIYNDAGISARKRYTKRPELLRTLEDCRSGKIEIVLFTKMDRFFRSVRDYYECLSVLESCKVKWRAIYENYDQKTPAGTLNLNMALSVSQFEADQTGERLRTVNVHRRAQGEWLSQAPTGYKSVQSHLVIDEEKKVAVRSAFETYMSTSSISAMHDVLLSNGVMVTRRTCVNMLSNPAYTGFSHNHSCVPYLTQEEYDLIQSRRSIGRTRNPKSPGQVYLFQGMIRCPKCGNMFRSKSRPRMLNSGKVVTHYYSCGKHLERLCDNKIAFSEDKLEKYCLSSIEKAMDDYISEVSNVSASDVANTEKEIKKIENQIRRIGDRYELDEITKEEYTAKVRDLRFKISELTPQKPHTIERLPDGWREVYDTLTPSNRKSFWSQSIRYITIAEDGTVTLYF